MLMLAEIGIPYRFVAEADVDELESTVEELIIKRASEKERLLALRDETWRNYLDQMRSALDLH
jgi:hypothetical protein